MSKQNKANRDSYMQAGRLTPDDMARERQRQSSEAAGLHRERMTNRATEQPRKRRGGQASTRPRSAPEE